MSTERPWWRGGAIYQIYPRSFFDTTGDGVGDLKGIVSKLDYIASLGVDALWVSPFFVSPMKDFGYDVADYRSVDPLFGTLDDFRELLHEAHKRNLRVMIDQVWSHSSDQHDWFVESRQSRDNPKSDWYVWRDAKPDGSPPNNWLSVFGGPSWDWDTRRRQYYLHNFLREQPDLNFHNPEVRDAIIDIARYWLDMGVDGFRLDVCNFYYQDADCRNNPANLNAKSKSNPHAWQDHINCRNQPETLLFIERLRDTFDEYEDRTLLGEIADDDGLPILIEYTSGQERLHSGYFFDFMLTSSKPTNLHKVLLRWIEAGEGWPTWALGNHDFARVATRWAGAEENDTQEASQDQLQLFATFQACLKGSICIYQGEELGLTQSKLKYEDLRDPQGIAMWPENVSRDGCRTPMPWNKQAPSAGFSESASTWLPVDKRHVDLAVDVQDKDSNSLLNYYRALIRWRRTQPSLLQGEIRLTEEHPQIIAFYRSTDDQQLLCVFNFSGQDAVLDLDRETVPLETPFNHRFELKARRIFLAPWAAAILSY